MPLEIRRENRSGSAGPAVVLAVGGELDLASLDQLDGAVDTALAGDIAHLVLDLEELTFCDSTGLGLFVRAHKRMRERGGQLSLAGVQPPVLKVIKLTGLDAALQLYPDVPLALAD